MADAENYNDEVSLVDLFLPLNAALVVNVRRHINWNNQGADLEEDLAHLVQDIKRRICGIASAGFSSFYV
jgi:hypothetical protein